MDDRLAKRLVPDRLWEIVAPLLPAPKHRPQGGGMALVDDRAVFTAIVTREEPEQLREAKKRIRLLEQENEILRRAAAYLARDINPK